MAFVRVALRAAQSEQGEREELEDFGGGVGLGYGWEERVFFLGRGGICGGFDFAEGAFDYRRTTVSTYVA